MDSFYDKQVDILHEVDGHMENGIWIDGALQVVKTIPCDIQPYSKDRAYRDYGYTIDCSKRMFCDPISFTENALIQYNDKLYTIEKSVEWDEYFSILLKDYKGNLKVGDIVG